MNITSIIFIILVLMIAFRYTKMFEINILIIIGTFLLWFFIVYIKIHLKNKDRMTPRPVYITP